MSSARRPASLQRRCWRPSGIGRSRTTIPCSNMSPSGPAARDPRSRTPANYPLSPHRRRRHRLPTSLRPRLRALPPPAARSHSAQFGPFSSDRVADSPCGARGNVPVSIDGACSRLPPASRRRRCTAAMRGRLASNWRPTPSTFRLPTARPPSWSSAKAIFTATPDFTWWTESGTAKPGQDFAAVTPRLGRIGDGERASA